MKTQHQANMEDIGLVWLSFPLSSAAAIFSHLLLFYTIPCKSEQWVWMLYTWKEREEGGILLQNRDNTCEQKLADA